ncbi:MAG: class I tRNA ligase family protein, partial [Haloferacaceae archaeon]
VYRRGLSVLTRLIAPVTPYLGEELWNLLRGEGLVAEADWPTPNQDVSEYTLERSVVETLRDDVRDIFEVAGIDDAEEIEVVVAPDWKYRAYQLARDADETDALVGQVMQDPEIRAVGEPAQAYVRDLQDRRRQLVPVLAPEEEYDLLERAGWLLRQEFDAAVTVRQADREDALARNARPGKPAIQIS